MSFKVYVQLLCMFLLTICDLTNTKQEENTLQQVHVIFRHGDRTVEKVSIYPTDPYANESYWYPYGFGSLTNKGKMQAYNIGKSLRKRYNDFLGNVYHPDLMYARSTNYDRTKMSLQLVLAALWPPTPLQLWNTLLPWQPIPYEYEPMEKDKLMKFSLVYCNKYRQEYTKAQNSEQIQTFLMENSQTISYINKFTGLNCETTLDLLSLYYVLYAEEQYNLRLPEWTKKVYPEFFIKATVLEYESQTYNDEMLKEGGGHLIKKIIQDSKAKMDNTLTLNNDDMLKEGGGHLINKILQDSKDNTLNANRRKLFLYSGHDFNIVQILASLKLFKGQLPTYASYIILEFHKINNQYGFKVYYQDYSESNPKLLTIPGCEQFCDFHKFFSLVFNILPDNDSC